MRGVLRIQIKWFGGNAFNTYLIKNIEPVLP